MSLQKKIYCFLLAIILYKIKGNAREMEQIHQGISHDSFTRLLLAAWDTQKRLFKGAKELVGKQGGHLILDDTILLKPHSKCVDGVSWLYDHKEQRYVKGLNLVMLIWTDGEIRIPVSYDIYKKGEQTKVQIALKLLSVARNQFQIKPESVLFDSWYGCKAIFKRLGDYGWCWVCRLKKNRCFNGKQLKHYKKHPYWTEIGFIKGGIKVKVVKHRKFYFATNRLGLERSQIRDLYSIRDMIEQYFRSLKTIFCPNGCQSRSYEAQRSFLCLTFLAHLALERLRIKMGVTIYKAAKIVRLKGEDYVNLVKKRILELA